MSPDPAPDVAVADALAAKRAEVAAELGLMTAPVADTGGISFGKRVGDGTSIAVERLAQVAAHDRLTALLADIDRAEAKLAEGTYGRCDGCGDTIPEERLEALPWATRCVTCARG